MTGSSEDYNIDRAFFHCLKEIEISYTTLPKALRLRIEKWVEKFITVGFNTVWKKNRNIPAEGQPLPPFPSYLIPKFKSALGPHESYFWRNIFDRVHEPQLQTFAPPPPPPSSSEHQASDFAAAPSPSYVKLDPTQKETHNLRLLMKEQSRRIELLEEQMQQERVKHQAELQQVLQHTHDETSRIKSLYRSNRDQSGYSDRNESIMSSNPYEIYDGNTTYGNSRHSNRSPVRSHSKPSASDMQTYSKKTAKANASYLPSDMNYSTGVPFPKSNNNSFIPESKYQQVASPKNKFNDSSSDKYQTSGHDYSIGIPVFTPGKEEISNRYNNSNSQQKTPLRSASKNVNFQDNKYDIRPFTLGNDVVESKDIYPPQPSVKQDIAPTSYTPDYIRSGTATNPRLQPTKLVDYSEQSQQSPAKSAPPFVKESIWPDYQYGDVSMNDATTYELAKGVVNRPDSNVAPVLKREVPEDEGEFMSYLEDFQKEIRHLQINTAHNKEL